MHTLPFTHMLLLAVLLPSDEVQPQQRIDALAHAIMQANHSPTELLSSPHDWSSGVGHPLEQSYENNWPAWRRHTHTQSAHSYVHADMHAACREKPLPCVA